MKNQPKKTNFSLKESVVKYDGKGISYGMKNIEIDLENKKIKPSFDFSQKVISNSFIISYVQ